MRPGSRRPPPRRCRSQHQRFLAATSANHSCSAASLFRANRRRLGARAGLHVSRAGEAGTKELGALCRDLRREVEHARASAAPYRGSGDRCSVARTTVAPATSACTPISSVIRPSRRPRCRSPPRPLPELQRCGFQLSSAETGLDRLRASRVVSPLFGGKPARPWSSDDLGGARRTPGIGVQRKNGWSSSSGVPYDQRGAELAPRSVREPPRG